MTSYKVKMDISQNIPFLRFFVCVLFFPCFFLMDTSISPNLYYIALITVLYSVLLLVLPQINNTLNKSYPIAAVFDLLFISLFIFFEKKYTLAFSLFYLFPIITLAINNKTFWTYVITTLASFAYLLVCILNNQTLPPIILQIIIFYILSFYVTTQAQNFHKSCFLLANLDTLTKIHNRRFFNNSMNSLISKNIPFSLILIDLDNFKMLNDTEGHSHGDYVLKIIANIMKQYTRNTDVIARFGGDEFAIILPETSKEKSKAIAERIRNSVMVNPKFIPYAQVSLSMGISAYPNDGHTMNEIIEKADEALYIAKSRGKNYIHLYK
ncbi:MAG: GGDEF domain-containing protein [Clostridia bacterium]|jgi:diguanylate cyclase (GGDEF)-like protein|nr:GGDEF domain-containing protein [Clostridia bacterium]